MHIPWGIFSSSIVIAVLAVPLILNKVPKNRFYGLRTARTLSGSDEQWYEVNRKGGIYLLIAGAVSAAACFVVPYFQPKALPASLICSGIFLILILAAASIPLLRRSE